MDPLYWSIGKITRFWDQDLQDLIQVFRKLKPDPIKVAVLWDRALKKSPKSTALFLVKKNALYFFKTFGPKIWGKTFSLEKTEDLKDIQSVKRLKEARTENYSTAKAIEKLFG